MSDTLSKTLQLAAVRNTVTSRDEERKCLPPQGIIVEVKRACDTRLRREVVGQMLDYAANGAMT